MENENESNLSVSNRRWFVEIDRFDDESLENVRGWFCKVIYTYIVTGKGEVSWNKGKPVGSNSIRST